MLRCTQASPGKSSAKKSPAQGKKQRTRRRGWGRHRVATGADDEAVQELFEWVRTRIGFYGSTPSYWPVFEVHGLQDLGLKLNDMSKKGQWDEMTKEVSDDVVHLFAAVGRHDELVGALTERFGGMADMVGLPEDTPSDLIQDVLAI